MAAGDDALKAWLHRYLRVAREALVWKLDGVSEHDARRPMTATGTNLLGLVKHMAGVEAGYLGVVFGRPFPEPLPAIGPGAEPNSDFWATAEESREDVVALYRRVWAHSDATLDATDFDAAGHVPWWGPDADVTLFQVLVHLTTETHRHAGHADILRELVDGTVGLSERDDNVWRPAGGWPAHVARLQEVADGFREG